MPFLERGVDGAPSVLKLRGNWVVYSFLAQAAALVVVVALLARGHDFVLPPVASQLIGFSLLFGLIRIRISLEKAILTPTFALECLGLLMGGPWVCLFVAAAGVLGGSLVRRAPRSWRFIWRPRQFSKTIYNLVNVSLAAAAGAYLYELIRQNAPSVSPRDLDERAFSLLGFTLVEFLINTAGVSIAIGWEKRVHPLQVWREQCLWALISYIGGASIALGMHLLLRDFGPVGVVIAIPVLALLAYHYRLGGEKVEMVRDQAERERRHLEELNATNLAIIRSLTTAIDAKDSDTGSHISRVQQYALALADDLGIEGPDRRAIELGAIVHDIGKLAIPDHILLKPGKLTPAEFDTMCSHVHIGAQILAPVNFSFPVLDIVRTHHEKWDGTGYPAQLAGEDIPLGGRIIALVDAFDAVTSERPYRTAVSFEDGIRLLKQGSGTSFDPNLVERFIRLLPSVRIKIEEIEAQSRAELIAAGEDHRAALISITEAARSSSGAGAPSETQSLPGGPVDSPDELAAPVEETPAGREIAAAAASSLSPEREANLLDILLKHLPVETCALYQVSGEELHLLHVAGKEGERLRGMRIRLGEGAAGRVALTREPVVNVSATHDVARRFAPGENIELSLATVIPLRRGDQAHGCLAVYTHRYEKLTERQVQLLYTAAELLAPSAGAQP